MKTKSLAIATTVGAVALMALLFAYPAMAASPAATSPQNSSQVQQLQNRQRISLNVGQTITLTSVAGGYIEVGDRSVHGNATGSMTLQVTGAFTGGYALSVTGGQVAINGTTYTVTGGSGELGPYGGHMVGQAQGGDSTQLLFVGRNLGGFGGTAYGVLRIDLTNGSNEFAVKLLVSIAKA